MLHVNDAKLIEIAGLGGCEVTLEDITCFLKREEEPGYEECPHEVMAYFLNGLIAYKRGSAEGRPPLPITVPITNNIVLKKIRVAFELKDTDVLELIMKSGLLLTKTELGAFFRNPGHRNYRECGDQFLRNLLKGLTP